MILDLERFFNIRNSLTQFFLLILTLSLFATVDAGLSTPHVWFYFPAIMLFSGTIVYFLRSVWQMQSLNPLNLFISSMIMYLLIHPTEPLMFYLIALSALALEKVIRGKRMAIFNPAALAIFITYCISQTMQWLGIVKDTLLISWWGVDFGQEFLSAVPLVNFLVPAAFLLGFIYFSNSYKKLPLSGMFFVVVAICLFFNVLLTASPITDVLQFLVAALFNAFAFLALVMIPEPKTSPSFIKQQLLVGAVGGLLFYLSTFVLKSIPDNYIITLLLMNLMTYGLKRARFLQT